MSAFLYYPLYLIIFWYKDVVGAVFDFFIDVNRYTASLLSLQLLLRTYFKPLKNEYREGLVLFSIIAGIFVKTFLIFISLSIVLLLLFIEILVAFLLLLLPFILIFIAVGPKL